MTPEVKAVTDALNSVDEAHVVDCLDVCEALIGLYGLQAVQESLTEAVERIEERGETVTR